MIDSQTLAEKASTLDAEDSLAEFRDQFYIPVDDQGCEEVYLAGNSLGLQPKQTREFVLNDLENWQTRGVRGHLEGQFPWLPYHEFLTQPMADIVGGLATEVVMMNSLTTNLHLMLATFYRPEGSRRKILIEEHAFPSDHYAVESQVRWHDRQPHQEMIVLAPERGEELISTSKVLQAIDYYRESLTVVLLPGIQYYTGQVFDMQAITELAHQFGIVVGFDLAHAAGNIELKLHEWDVDFAVWCSYKYLNSGPGSVAGCFVHERHAGNTEKFRLAGWWGHDKATRFKMENRFCPIPTVEGWQLSNPPILSLSAVRASLDLFARAGMDNLISKSNSLTGFLIECLEALPGNRIEIITPREADHRGCQLSLKVKGQKINGRKIHAALESSAFRTDWREPNVIRAAPVPLYNSFADVLAFATRLDQILG